MKYAALSFVVGALFGALLYYSLSTEPDLKTSLVEPRTQEIEFKEIPGPVPPIPDTFIVMDTVEVAAPPLFTDSPRLLPSNPTLRITSPVIGPRTGSISVWDAKAGTTTRLGLNLPPERGFVAGGGWGSGGPIFAGGYQYSRFTGFALVSPNQYGAALLVRF